MFALVWFRRRRKIVVQVCSTIITSSVDIQMVMYELDKVHGMSMIT